MTRLASSGFVSALAASLALLAAPALAQGAGYSYLTYTGPDVSLVSPGEEDVAAEVHAPIVPGDRISTGLSSRAEAILADGTVVRVDADSEVRFERLARTYESGDDRTLLVLSYGALAVETRATANLERVVRIDTVDATVIVPSRAYVRVDEGPRGTEVWVRSGYAEVLGRAGQVTLGAGETACVKDEEPIDVAEGDLPRDAFTRFLDERRPRRGGESLRYLEPAASSGSGDGEWDEEATAYEASLLDDAGSWVYVARYGRYCFRPRVPADWRPYSSGTWRFTPSGMTWVAYEPWGWLPSHFGTWVFDETYGWLWIPDWVYSPAWVFWIYTPSWVGWCPVGFYGGNGGSSGGGGVVDGRFEPGSGAFVRGRVEIARIDPRGWSWVSASRMGTRLERGDVVRTERVSSRAGETAVMSAERLRVERTSDRPLRVVLQETLRSAAMGREERALPATAPARVEAPAPRGAGPSRAEPVVVSEPARGGPPSPRFEPASPAPPRAEPQRVEAQRAEAQRVEAQRIEAQRIEAQRAETQRAEAQRVEAQRAEAQRVEAQRAEAQRQEAQRAEAQRAEAQRVEAQRAEAQRAEAQREAAHRAEAQRAETQRAEAQRSEPPPRVQPQPEPPRFEPQRSEPSRSEPPPAPRAEPEAPRSEHRG